MRTVVKDKISEWREVISGVSRGSVLVPIMFLIYVNGMTEGVSRKPQGLLGATEWDKQDIWMEQDMGNGI